MQWLICKTCYEFAVARFITFLCPLNSGTTLTITPVVAAALVTLISWLLSAQLYIKSTLYFVI
jgi:hypothetical protein